MAGPGLLSDRSELEALFDKLAAELPRLDVAAEVVMVGGAWLLWHAQRVATREVDSARRLAAELTEAVEVVGKRHDLPRGWLNDAAAAFWPTGSSFDDCRVVYEQDSLVVRTPPPDVIFVMKLYRADPQDREDMVLLWPMCGFSSPEDAVEAFAAAYPHPPEDEHLVDYVREIAEDASGG
ncbi:MAG: hypothetical protein M3Q48_07605 [Actinomycetota bacterium]|nr:hypothetical protein [Actinomycetota bacterium]